MERPSPTDSPKIYLEQVSKRILAPGDTFLVAVRASKPFSDLKSISATVRHDTFNNYDLVDLDTGANFIGVGHNVYMPGQFWSSDAISNVYFDTAFNEYRLEGGQFTTSNLWGWSAYWEFGGPGDTIMVLKYIAKKPGIAHIYLVGSPETYSISPLRIMIAPDTSRQITLNTNGQDTTRLSVTNLRLSNSSLVPDGTVYNLFATNGSIATADANVVETGVQVSSANGSITFDVRAGFRAGKMIVLIQNAVNPAAYDTIEIRLVNTQAPDTPTGLTVTSTGMSGEVRLSWNAISDSDLWGYQVYFDTDAGAPYSGVSSFYGASPLLVRDTTFLMRGLQDNLTWHFSVRAVDLSDSLSGYSASASATPNTNSSPETVTLSASATGGIGGAYLTWNSYSAPADAVKFWLYSETQSFDSTVSISPRDTLGISLRSYEKTGLTNGETYWFAVVCVDSGGGYDTRVRAVSVVPRADTRGPDTVPLRRVSAIGARTAEIGWSGYQKPSNLAGYKIYIDTASFDSTQIAGRSPSIYLDATTETYSLGALTEGRRYYVAVVAYDVAGNAIPVPPQALSIFWKGDIPDSGQTEPDGIVDKNDVARIILMYKKTSSSPGYSVYGEVKETGSSANRIDEEDLFGLGARFGRSVQ